MPSRRGCAAWSPDLRLLAEPGGGLHGDQPPGAMLARLRPVLWNAGITRVAVLTGLDELGVPVAAAMRPNSRSIAVHQGKGATLDAAKLAAVMEGIECFCAENLDLPLRLATPVELAARVPTLDVARLAKARGGGDPATSRLLWVEGVELLSDTAVWVPREVVAADWSLPAVPGETFFQASTNGLGAGSSIAAATLHGLLEVIERDAVAVWRARPAAARRVLAIDPASVEGPASRALLDRFAAHSAFVALWDATSDIGVPCFVALLGDAAGRLQPELGFGCHPHPDAALFRALTEAAQSRLTVISGARDDFSEGDYDPRARDDFAREQRVARPDRRFAATRVLPGGDLAALLAALSRVGVRQVARVDLSRPEIAPACVVRIVVPGLEGGHTGPEGEYRPGARAIAAAAST